MPPLIKGTGAVVIDINVLSQKIPLNTFPGRYLRILSELATITEHQKGEVVFNIGDHDDLTAYLVYGKVALESLDGKASFISDHLARARYALGNLKPRKYMATAIQDHTLILWIKSDVITKVSIDQTGTYQVVSSIFSSVDHD